MILTSATPDQNDVPEMEDKKPNTQDGLHIDEILRRAHQIHREHGGLFGYELEDWNQAWRESGGSSPYCGHHSAFGASHCYALGDPPRLHSVRWPLPAGNNHLEKVMKINWSISAIFAVVLSAFASAPLFAQAMSDSVPNDPVTTARSEKVQLLSTQQGRPAQLRQSQNVSQTGQILGTVTDINDGPVPGATVSLKGSEPGDVRSVTTDENGFFEIGDVEPGRPYEVSIRAAGFSEWESPVVTIEPGQSKILEVSKLEIEEVQTSITVTPESSEEIATEQVKTEERQRGFAIIPNFYAVYTPDPAPLTAKLKFTLALRVVRDPFTLGGVALVAGIGQATDDPSYVQGAKGYAERFGVNYANSFTDVMLYGAVLPSLLHQDPRFFYQEGTSKSRAVHAISSLVITKGDDGRLQPNYSGLGGDLASAAVSNLYYPKANRGVGLVFERFALNSAIHVAVRLLDEFVFRPSISAGN
jgi:hypothetical protein